MIDREKVVKGLESLHERLLDAAKRDKIAMLDANIVGDALALLKAQEPITGETSDGYHTFNDLYHHRAVLFSVIVANYPDRAWKSKKHHDGTMYNGMFIVGIDTPDGQATYHYDVDPYWDMFKCRVLDNAPEWDGHTPAQAIERIGKLKAQEPRVMTLWEAVGIIDRPVYLERNVLMPDKSVNRQECWALVCATDDEHMIRLATPYGEEKWHVGAYGIGWRCWTSRPTEEQREAIPWND